MINGVRGDLTPRMTEGTTRKDKPGDSTSFADQLFAKKDNRTERIQLPGREESFRASREGMRKDERGTLQKDDSETKSRSSRETNHSEKRKAKRQDSDQDQRSSSSSQMLPTREDLAPVRVQRRPEPAVDDGLTVQEAESGDAPVSEAGKSTSQPTSSSWSLSSFFQVPSMDGAAGKAGAAMATQKTGDAKSPTQETLQLLAQLRDQQTQSRQEAIAEFVNSMEKVVGVPPDKILSAFAKMNDQALQATPEESMDSFLANLEVPGKQKVAAAELYAALLKKTEQADLASKVAVLDAGVSFNVVSPKEDSLRKLNSAVDGLANSFFMRNQQSTSSQAAIEKMDSELTRLMEQSQKAKAIAVGPGLQDAKASEKAMSEDALMAALGLTSGATASEVAGDAQVNALKTKAGDSEEDFEFDSMSGDAFEMEDMSGLPELDLAGGSELFDSGAGMESDLASQQNAMSEASAMKTQEPSAFMASMKANQTSEAKVSSGKESEDSSKSQASLDSAQVGPISLSAPSTPAATASGPSAMILDRPMATAQDEQANVRELIRQAQLAVKKGGGEMQMELRPEGIGKVKLKVAVEDGQVRIEMLTENDASKRLLEKGLNELRSSLASHQLRVDNLKVDVGSEIQRHLEHNQEQAREQARQLAQDFMGQFREDRQAFRQGMMENPGWRTYNKTQSRQMEPEPVVSSRSYSSMRPDGTKRLNLVA